MFQSCCFPDCSIKSNRECHSSLLLLLWRIKSYWSVRFVPLGKQTSHWIVTHELVAKILSTQWEDVCIVVMFHCLLYQTTSEAWEKTGGILKDIDSHLWVMNLSHLSLVYNSLGVIECRSDCTFPEVPACPFTGRQLPLFKAGSSFSMS